MRRMFLGFATCATISFALVGSAQAAGDPTGGAGGAVHGQSRAVKPPKAKVYEWCGSLSGCGYETDLWAKTKTFGFFGGVAGIYFTGPKGSLTLYDENTNCYIYLKKIKKTKNYAGEEPAGQEPQCAVQTVELTYIR
ncbi:MAG TPA: hypothetical protein VMG80_04045 [Solirubrobacteraceae bacterium]|nr:hypothetical protein [Solirubrobacteraceae bacterium]